MDLCNSAEYATAMAQAALNDGLDPVAYASNYGLNLNASQGIGIQAYDLSVSNATDKYSALFSLGYKKNNGILKYTDFENFSGRVNTNENRLSAACQEKLHRLWQGRQGCTGNSRHHQQILSKRQKA